MTSKNSERLLEILAATDVDSKHTEFIDKIRKQNEIVIYGAGNKGRWIQLVLREFLIEVRAFLDINADNIGRINGTPVYRPESTNLKKKDKEDVYVLIVTRKKFYSEIKTKLYELGYRNVNPYISVWYMGGIKSDLNYIANKRDDILSCAKILEDKKSCQVYEDSLLYYINGNYDTSFIPEYDNQYFPADVYFSKGYSNFIDCGAFNGDTIEELFENKGKIDTIIAFEPSIKEYEALTKKISDNQDKFAKNVFTFPCGVYNKLEQLKFAGGSWEGGCISEEGESAIQCIPLDYALAYHSLTFLKMDIEGAEYEALLGAKTIIRKHKPDLAICVYHFLADLYRIPLLIHGWNLGYKFYLRSHSDFNEELVLYATCE